MKKLLILIVPFVLLLFAKGIYELILALFPLSRGDAGFLAFVLTIMTACVMFLSTLYEINER
jgi:hypothetical protein